MRCFLAPKTYVWFDYNITMMCDACVVGTQMNSLGETFIESPKIYVWLDYIFQTLPGLFSLLHKHRYCCMLTEYIDVT